MWVRMLRWFVGGRTARRGSQVLRRGVVDGRAVRCGWLRIARAVSLAGRDMNWVGLLHPRALCGVGRIVFGSL